MVGLSTKIQSRRKLNKVHNGAVMCVRFSKDGLFLASCGGDKLVCVYSVESGGLISKHFPHDRYVSSCAFSLSNTFFATGSNDKCVSIFNLNIEGDKKKNDMKTIVLVLFYHGSS